jgi:hypothetical protein
MDRQDDTQDDGGGVVVYWEDWLVGGGSGNGAAPSPNTLENQSCGVETYIPIDPIIAAGTQAANCKWWSNPPILGGICVLGLF